jgi:beta-lactamase superfamily II metal-dependent hydrolase
MKTIGLLLLAAWITAQVPPAKAFNIYVVDVEGGNATLFVSPSGESLLMDTGNGGAAASRDADRIMAAVKDAGVSRLDHLITTHSPAAFRSGTTSTTARPCNRSRRPTHS